MAHLLLKYIPEDVIFNHIVPYTYLQQADMLQTDIRTCVFTRRKVMDIYGVLYAGETPAHTDMVMKFDIIEYYANTVLAIPPPPSPDIYTMPFFILLLKKRDSEAIGVVWGRMAPVDRLKFITKLLGIAT
jgi:hypothetical protein